MPGRAVLVAALGLGGCAGAALAAGWRDRATAPLSTDGAWSLPGPVAGVVLALVLLTVVAAVAPGVLGRRRTGPVRDAAGDEPAVRPPDLAATLSHEVRTPLNAVVGLTELLLTSRLDAPQRDQLTQVRRSALVILGLVDGVLDRAAVDAGRLRVEHQPFELADLLADAVELLQVDADAKGVRLRAELDPTCPHWVRGDAPRLQQVLVNLLGNAVKYTDTGVVTVEVCRAARPEEPEALYFQVTDTGPGIPRDQLERVFEPYARFQPTDQPRRRGTGLGLSISRTLVQGLGGDIAVTSQPGVGSAFGFELVLPAEPVPTAVASTLAHRRVVLLDRQPLRAARTADELRAWGAAVELTLPRHRSADAPDLVVVREDHPDELALLGTRLRRSPAWSPPLLLVTDNVHAVPVDAVGVDDRVIGATAAGRQLRSALVSLNRPRPSEAAPPAVVVDERPLRVLLAEDDPTSRHVCEVLVRLLGHDVDVVADGAAAVRAASSSAYDLVLMDSQMPGLDGVEATRAIRAGESDGQRVRVVALTGSVGDADQALYASAGMDGVLAKPLTRVRLERVLADVPRRPGRPADVAAGADPAAGTPALPLAC